MEDKEVIDLVKKVVQSIETGSLDKKSHKKTFEKSFNIKKYPRIKFQIGQREDEINKLKRILDNTEALHAEVINSDNVYLKLLYSITWKQNNLSKLASIIKGITEPDTQQKNGVVFNSFGKHLRDRANPIIDQHVIRAYLAIQAIEKSELKDLSSIRELKDSFIDKKQEEIKNYKEWLDKIYQKEVHKNNKEDFFYYVDQILFTLGKTIKSK